MARIVTTGYEVSVALGDQNSTADASLTAGTITRDTSVFRSGVASLKANSAAGVQAYAGRNFPAAVTEMFLRAYVRFTNVPTTTTTRFVEIIDNSEGVVIASVRISSGGIVSLNDSAGAAIATGTTPLSTATWYRIELRIKLVTGNDDYELRINGTTEFSGSAAISATTDMKQILLGWLGTEASKVVNFDDVAVNSIAGADQNSWPGEGKVVLCKPISDLQIGTWTGGAGGVTNLWNAVDNTPPIGTATETDLTQIESVDTSGNNATDEYRANLTTYADAGIVAGDTITVLQPFINHGEDSATGTKTGSFGLQANPVVAYDTFNFGGDAGALGTFPTNWRWTLGAPVYVPSVTRASSPVLAVRKTDAGVEVASVDVMGMYVEYVPIQSATGRTSLRFYGPALLTNAAADLYTVPTGRRATIRHIHVSNPTASPVDFTLSIGADAAATRLYDGYPVPAEDLKQEFRDHTLVAGEKIQGFAGTASVLNLTIDGYEESV